MKKILFLLMLILAVQTPCFAEDIYIGTYDDSDFYLKTEYLSRTMKAVTGQSKVIAVIDYTVAEVPHAKKLKDMQDLVFDSTVTHQERRYEAILGYDRIDKAWNMEHSRVEIKRSIFRTTDYKIIYEQSINSSLVCYLNTTDADNLKHIATYNAAVNTISSDSKKYSKWTIDGK